MGKAARERTAIGWKAGDARAVRRGGHARGGKGRAGTSIRALHLRSHLSQQGLAKGMRARLSRVAKVENHEAGVSLDLKYRHVAATRPVARRELRRLVEK